MKHKTRISGYKMMDELCEEIGNLRYDSLADFLKLLRDKLKNDSEKDLKRGRNKLAAELFYASCRIKEASESIGKAWGISSPHMKPEELI